MASAGKMTKTIADATGVALSTVTVVVRALREANLLTKGARGINAPDMKPIDTARVLIALLASDRPVDAVKLVNEFGQFPRRVTYITPPPDHIHPIFEEDLADLIEAIALKPINFPLSSNVNVQLDFKHMKCIINNGKQSFDYTHRSYFGYCEGIRADAKPYFSLRNLYAQSRIRRVREIESETLMEVAQDHRLD